MGSHVLCVLDMSSTDSTELLSGILSYLQVWTRDSDRSYWQRMGSGYMDTRKERLLAQCVVNEQLQATTSAASNQD